MKNINSAKLVEILQHWTSPPSASSEIGKKHHDYIKVLIEAYIELKKEKDVLGDRCNALERQVKDLLSHKKTEESGLSIGLSYSEVLTGNKNINEAEVVLLTKVSRWQNSTRIFRRTSF